MGSNSIHPKHGYLVLADISGYEAYVTGTEFEHAQEIVMDLLEFLVQRLRPLLNLVQVEGDALFAYTPEDRISRGETLFELVESTYTAFKYQLTSIQRYHTCSCAACQNVNTLDLKFFIHYGKYVETSFDDHHGLLGYAPMFVRKREWKEPVAVAAGWQGYALFSEQSVGKLNLDLDGLETAKFAEAPVGLFGLNLQTRYEQMLETRQVQVQPNTADASLRSELDAPPHVVWEWLNDPQKRNQWWESYTRWTQRLRPGGRTGPGAVNHCNHAAGSMLETILDWRPFDSFTVRMDITPGRFHVMQTTYLEPLPGDKTGVAIYYQLQKPHPGWMARPVCRMVAGFLAFELKRLNRLLANP